ncbi:MAG: hypothetical protein N2C12_00960 [Planctomycetales bacterium]
MVRKILAVLLGILIGGVFNMAMVTVSNTIYPLPAGIDPNDFEAFTAYVEANGLPSGALLIVLVAHAGGSFVSGFACGLIARRTWYVAAAFLGVVWMCGGIAMLVMLPSPIWFALADIVLYVPVALLGVKLGGTLTGNGSPQVATT